MGPLSIPVYTCGSKTIPTLLTKFVHSKLKDYDANEIAAKLESAGLAILE